MSINSYTQTALFKTCRYASSISCIDKFNQIKPTKTDDTRNSDRRMSCHVNVAIPLLQLSNDGGVKGQKRFGKHFIIQFLVPYPSSRHLHLLSPSNFKQTIQFFILLLFVLDVSKYLYILYVCKK